MICDHGENAAGCAICHIEKLRDENTTLRIRLSAVEAERDEAIRQRDRMREPCYEIPCQYEERWRAEKERAERAEAENATLTAACAAWRDKAERAESAFQAHDVALTAAVADEYEQRQRAERAEADRDEAVDGECQRACERDEARAALARAREVLREVEWGPAPLGAGSECPWCLQPNMEGHLTDCALKAALEDG